MPFQARFSSAALGLGFALAYGPACVITVPPLDCSECGNVGCHSTLVAGECLCEPGYERGSADADDYDCHPIPGKGGAPDCGGDASNPVHPEGDVCVCDGGYNWCSPDDLEDLSCCLDENQVQPEMDTEGSGTTSGSETGSTDETGEAPGDCQETPTPPNGSEPDAADCTEDGLVFCSNTEAEGPAGSRYWECIDGAWVEAPMAGDANCRAEGSDFGYGCVDNGTDVEFVCGTGPGTHCDGAGCDACGGDGDQILFCDSGKLGADSCLRVCSEEGDANGVTFDHGECVVGANGVPGCECCNAGDEGCPA